MQTEKRVVLTTAKTLDLALEKASKELGGHSANDLDYEVISRTDAGLLSFLGGKKIEVKAWLKNSTEKKKPNHKAAAKPNSKSEPEKVLPDLSKQELDELIDDLRTFCAGICKYIAVEDVEVDASLEEDRLNLNINNDFLSGQITKNPRLAESIEHILRKKPRYLKRELPFRIFIDANGIRKTREEELKDMAKDLSQKVAENQKPIVLNYKSSYDRKIIHMALDKDARVYTKSIGSGANRKLMILPAKATEGNVNHEYSG